MFNKNETSSRCAQPAKKTTTTTNEDYKNLKKKKKKWKKKNVEFFWNDNGTEEDVARTKIRKAAVIDLFVC